MSALRPRLRPEIQVERGASVVVADPVLRRRLDLGAIGDVLDRMDGRDVDAIVTELGPRAEAILRTLMLLGFLDGPGRDTVERMRALARGDLPLEPVFLPESRFACQGSGGCCRNYVFGPLTEADVARIEALDLTPFGVTGRFWEPRPRPDGRVERFLKTTPEGRCGFLQPGERCGLHARYGGASKPGFCQLFPLVAQATIAGLRVADNGECASFSRSARSGPPLADLFSEVQAYVPANLPIHHPLVHVSPGLVCDYGFYLPMERRLLDAVGADPAPVTIRRLGRMLDAWRTAVRTCPLREGEPDASVEAALATEAPPAPPTPEAIAPVAAELRDAFAAGLSLPSPPPFTRAICAALDRIARGDPLPPGDPDEPELFRLSARQRLFGPRSLVSGRPMAGLLRLAFDWLLTRYAGERFDDGHLLATRRLDMPWPPIVRVFVQHEASTRGILEALPLL